MLELRTLGRDGTTDIVMSQLEFMQRLAPLLRRELATRRHARAGPGAELAAMKIRDTATETKVPVLQAPALARALYAHAELDREIPAALFAAVAQVLAYVYQLCAALKGHVAMPNALPELNVPKELDPHHKPVPEMEIFD